MVPSCLPSKGPQSLDSYPADLELSSSDPTSATSSSVDAEVEVSKPSIRGKWCDSQVADPSLADISPSVGLSIGEACTSKLRLLRSGDKKKSSQAGSPPIVGGASSDLNCSSLIPYVSIIHPALGRHGPTNMFCVDTRLAQARNVSRVAETEVHGDVAYSKMLMIGIITVHAHTSTYKHSKRFLAGGLLILSSAFQALFWRVDSPWPRTGF